MKHLKMYICILDWVDPGHAINSAAHAGMIGYLKWRNDPIMREWLSNSFRKITCEITQQQFDYLTKNFEDYQIITELAFDGKEVGLVFKPRSEWPIYFNYLKLWGKKWKN